MKLISQQLCNEYTQKIARVFEFCLTAEMSQHTNEEKMKIHINVKNIVSLKP